MTTPTKETIMTTLITAAVFSYGGYALAVLALAKTCDVLVRK